MSLKDDVDGRLREAVEVGDVPGVVAMATTGEDVFYQGAFGVRVLGVNDPMTTDTVCRLASMTKAITAAAAMQLVERGALELEVPVSRWVPQIGELQVLDGFQPNGEPRLRLPRRPITLRHLLTHTSGCAYEHWSADMLQAQRALGLPSIGTCRLAALDSPLLFDPGERWCYGTSIDWVGRVIEAVSGTSLGTHLRQHVLGPLEMNDTAFTISARLRARLAKAHQRRKDGSFEPLLDWVVPQDPEFEMGGGGLYGTAEDYCRFVRMFLNDGRGPHGQVLKPETVRTMARNHIGHLSVGRMTSVNPSLSNDAEFLPGMRTTWGLSFQINTTEAPSGRSAGSLFWSGVANTYFWIDPSRGIGGVFMTQVLPWLDEKTHALYTAFETAVYRSLA